MSATVLTVAGTDPVGGAGIQADIKAITACGGYALSAITAVVAQNTQGVTAVESMPPAMVTAQLDAIAADTPPHAIKIGMLADPQVTAVVRQWVVRHNVPLVVDPVMVATSGDELVTGHARDALWDLLPHATVITPNIPELAVLSGLTPAVTDHDLLDQGVLVAQKYSVAVLAKGGHRPGANATDVLVPAPGSPQEEEGPVWFTAPRIDTTATHGTGCSLSSAIATFLARGLGLSESVQRAKTWLTQAIRTGDTLNIGHGNGPVNHLGDAAPIFARAGLNPDDHLAQQSANIAATWWEDIASIRHRIDDGEFVRDLGRGTLSADAFAWYLQQDSAYLREYSRALALASAYAPTTDEQEFWARGAHTAIHVEAGMHHTWLADAGVTGDIVPSQVTAGYVSHLLAAGARGDYAGLIAALLPCYWLYQDIGMRLYQNHWHPEHPYGQWLATYHDEAFAQATARAIEIVTRTAASADLVTQDRMRQAFVVSSQWEHDFFAAPIASRPANTGEQGSRGTD
ncbi:bifunctional hydroxymethylpyrimidine kinase/phosphomethylpyrimidine kinase [Jonesia quinghaiensis]|uniref:bifunctional hydroxymethylpyrimidine kinase/phosphomethylpyrimidine kinase n=1 Tax=Jonesia quinghaiensis TaxID=262806 RepID=UPI0004280C32|nr:bifunctional hydroxymethylpyrimidine kinase/phosphomethylpyrimidine kinase [Jonesia quinghaiensis]